MKCLIYGARSKTKTNHRTWIFDLEKHNVKCVRKEYEMNLFIFIIWNRAYNMKTKIIEDIYNNFIVHKVIEIEWSKELFSRNLSRFYGENLPPNCNKELDIGTQPFTLVVVEDKNPIYELRKTTRGEIEKVNVHMFDSKKKYRSWTGINNSRVHCSNTVEETKHDLTLLLGLNPSDFMKIKDKIKDRIKKDLVGARGWKSMEQLFYVLNETCEYVVMRNFEGLPESFFVSGHNDIDLLVDRFDNVLKICNGHLVYKNDYRVQVSCKVAKKKVQVDIRYLGDGYYDKGWEENILKNRIIFNNLYIPDNDNYKYMLLYHALVHKKEIKSDYKKRLNELFGTGKWSQKVLDVYMGDNNYKYCEPRDFSVFYNYKQIGEKASLLRRMQDFYMKVLN